MANPAVLVKRGLRPAGHLTG